MTGAPCLRERMEEETVGWERGRPGCTIRPLGHSLPQLDAEVHHIHPQLEPPCQALQLAESAWVLACLTELAIVCQVPVLPSLDFIS